MADPAPPRSDLPAPYASPWGSLGVALRAVLASLRLKLRELWRRNAEGDLSVPGFWPQGLAALFWPLMLAVLLALPVVVWRLLPHPAPEPHPAPGPPASMGAPAPPASPGADSGAAAEPGAGAAPAEPPSPAPEPPPLELDPLLALLAEDDPDHLIASAHPEPAEGRLVLTMQLAYGLQAPAARRRWAERWQERADGLGYGRLELVDGDGRLLARGALVGSGMILLDPSPPA